MSAQSDQERKWEIEDAARTLIRAEQIKKEPKLYKSAMAEVKKQRDAAAAAYMPSKKKVARAAAKKFMSGHTY